MDMALQNESRSDANALESYDSAADSVRMNGSSNVNNSISNINGNGGIIGNFVTLSQTVLTAALSASQNISAFMNETTDNYSSENDINIFLSTKTTARATATTTTTVTTTTTLTTTTAAAAAATEVSLAASESNIGLGMGIGMGIGMNMGMGMGIGLGNLYSNTPSSAAGIALINSNGNGNAYNSVTIKNMDMAIDDDDMIDTFQNISYIITLYYVPILFIVGSLGNIFSVIVFSKTKLRKLSSSYYLSALAISDTCYLLGLFIQWINVMDIEVYNREFFCQMFTYSSSLSSFCSAWFVVAFTVERFIAVMYPLQRQTMCTIQRAKLVLAGLTMVGCLHCAPFAFASQSVYSPEMKSANCDVKGEYQEFMTLYNYWDTLVVYGIPFVVIIILNSFTGHTVWKFANLRRALTMQRSSNRYQDAIASDVISPLTYRMTSLRRQQSTASRRQLQTFVPAHDDDSTSPCTNVTTTASRLDLGTEHAARRSGRRRNANSSQLKVTKMLLIVSTVFVCFNLPSCVLRIITYRETQTSTNKKSTIVMQYIFQLLFITNFGINFVLYCFSGQNFREAVASMFRRVSSTHREGNTQVTVSEYCRNSGPTGTSTRRRMMTQHCWNEMHELHPLKVIK